MKLYVDINVAKVFLESSFYQYVENRSLRFCHALTDNYFHPHSLQLNVNWDEN